MITTSRWISAMTFAMCAGTALAEPISAEVTARLKGGVGGITTLPSGQLVIGYHPFYSPEQKVGLLNPTRDDTTPYPNADWQTC